MGFVAEILHGLVVQQTVDGLGVGVGIGLVHAAHELDAPFRERDGKHDIGRNCTQCDGGEAPVVETPQDTADQHDLEQGGQDVEGREADQEFHALRAAFDDPAQSAGLALEVVSQRQCMQMPEHLQGEIANRSLRYRRKNGVTQFAEGLREHTRGPIGHDQGDRHRDGLRRRLSQGVHGLLVENGDVDVGDLGQNQQDHGHDHADAQASFTNWPQMARQNAHDRPGARGAELGNAAVAGRRHER